jgi:Rod binding domain-containing protein
MEILSHTALNPAQRFLPIDNEVDLKALASVHEAYSLEKPSGDEMIAARKAKLMDNARGFEAIFIRQLLSTMRSTMSDHSMFGGGVSGDLFGDIAEAAVAETLAKRNTLGIARILYNAYEKNVEAHP